MHLLIKPRICLLVSFSLLLFFNGKSQTLDQTIAYADKQFELENYYHAISEYKRVVFFDSLDRQEYLHNKIAEAYFSLGDFEKAYNHFDVALRYNSQQSSIDRYLFMLVECQIHMNEYNQALADLLSYVPETSEQKKRFHFYSATIYFGLEDFEQFEHHVYQCVELSDTQRLMDLDNMFSRKKLYDKPNPKTAMIMSIIIPGMGQFYSGNIKDGANSLILTSGIIALAFVVTKNYGLVDGILTAMPWYQRYYQGGFMKAQQRAYEKRHENRITVFREVIVILQP